MEFQTVIHKLVARICAYCREKRLLDPGQVRTTKLAYLIECEYYAWEKNRLTDLDWIFWHYGPWSPTLDKVLKDEFGMPQEEEPKPGQFRPVHWEKPEFGLPELKFDVTGEGVILTVLDRFAAMPYNELLDYVYFETPPMLNAIKGKELDFTRIQKPQRFIDPVSLLPPKTFHKLREQFSRLDMPEPTGCEAGGADEDLLKLLAAFDEEGAFELPGGEIIIDEEAQSGFRSTLGD